LCGFCLPEQACNGKRFGLRKSTTLALRGASLKLTSSASRRQPGECRWSGHLEVPSGQAAPERRRSSATNPALFQFHIRTVAPSPGEQLPFFGYSHDRKRLPASCRGAPVLPRLRHGILSGCGELLKLFVCLAERQAHRSRGLRTRRHRRVTAAPFLSVPG
jgi:hypothetical protein